MKPIEITQPDGSKLTTARPWAKRTEELFASEGPYADYAAWEEWMTQRIENTNHPHPVPRGGVMLDDLESHEVTALYHVCCSLADGDAQP